MSPTIGELGGVPRFIVAISPRDYGRRLTLERCKDIVFTSQVRARGWYFPHISLDALAAGPESAYLQNETETSDELERWRLYLSGQFVFEGALWEYGNVEQQAQMRRSAERHMRQNAKPADGFLNFIMCIFSISEAYVLASRLTQQIPYDTTVEIMVGYKSVANWGLASSRPGIDLYGPYTSLGATVTSRKVVPVDDLVARPLDLALDSIADIFAQFGWLDPQPSMMMGWQTEIFPRK
jgi:hypothetical protein